MNDGVGIYRIVSPSGKSYVGMTNDSFKRRWLGHLKDLRSGKHKCKGLQRAFDKYGEAGLRFEILAGLQRGEVTKDAILILEAKWWDKLKDSGVILYNGRPTGTGSVIHLDETKVRQRNSAPNLNSGKEYSCTFCLKSYRTARRWRSKVFCSLECREEFHNSTPKKGTGRKTALLKEDLLQEISDLYSSGKSLHEIGAFYGVSYRTVHAFMVRHNIPRRGSREAQLLARNFEPRLNLEAKENSHLPRSSSGLGRWPLWME